MLQRTLSISNWLVLAIGQLVLAGCALTAPPSNDFSAPPLEQVFSEPYENIWRATQMALTKYPMKINDVDAGIFETAYIRGDKAWVSPSVETESSGGQRYKLTIKIIKGKNASGEPATKVTILKRAEIQRDFFSEFQKQPSDGLEEKSMMYRIERELAVEKALKKVKR